MAYSDKLKYIQDHKVVFVDEEGELLTSIQNIIKENAFQAREYDWTDDEMNNRSKYEAYKIMKTIEDFLK